MGNVFAAQAIFYLQGLFLDNSFVQLAASKGHFLLSSCTAKVHSFRKKAFFLALGAKSLI